MTLDSRKAAILRTVVEQYVETGQPVGSSVIGARSGFDVSSATIRNEMASLEREGYLLAPHTSAGRIPTEKGYRFFVDEFALPTSGKLTQQQQVKVKSVFDHAYGELEQMLQATTNLLSNLTQYAAVVVEPPHEEAKIRSIQLVQLSGTIVLMVVVLSNGVLEKRTLELKDPITDLDAADVAAKLSQKLIGQPWHKAPKPTEQPANELFQAALRSVGGLSEEERAFVGGTSQMLASFDAVETVRNVVSTLEQQFIVVGLLREILDRGLSVAIGSEIGVEPLAECSVVVAPYSVDGVNYGSIGVLGPTRMDYSRALATVTTVSQRLSERLTEGS